MCRRLGVVTSQPAAVVIVTLAITLFAASRVVDLRTGAIHIRFDPSTNALLPDGDEGRLFYDHVRNVFGSDETILVAVGAGDSPDIFTSAHLRRIQRMGERIEAIPGVHHVTSLSTALNIRGSDDGLSIEPFVEHVPEDPAELREIRRQALSNPIYAGNIVSRDGPLLTAYLNPPISSCFYSLHAAGRRLAEFLLRRIDGEPAEALQEVVRTELIERG